MANKTYTVEKDGIVLKEMKTLAAAKKLADAEMGEVLCDGETVYTPQPTTSVTPPTQSTPVVEEKLKTEEKREEKLTGLYRLKALMNVRTQPSLKASILNAKPAGTLVAVEAIEGDWLKLVDGGYILFEAGKYAEKM